MKRLLLVAVLCLLVAGVGATSLNFNYPTDIADGTYLNTTSTNAAAQFVWQTTDQNGYMYTVWDGVSEGSFENAIGSPMTYSSCTFQRDGGSNVFAKLYASDRSLMYSFFDAGTGTNNRTRFEINVVGGTAYFYKNGVFIKNSTPLTQNPSYVKYYGYLSSYAGYWDDCIWGDNEDKTVLDVPDYRLYVLKKDMTNPAASGLYFYSNSTLINSNTMITKFSQTNVSGEALVNKTIQLINSETGTAYATKYTNNYTTNSTTWDLPTALFNSGAPYGKYKIRLGTTESSEIWYLGSGASIAFNKEDYSGQDTATLAYSIGGTYWDTSTYSYSIDVVSGTTGATLHSEAISTSSGTSSYTFTSTDPLGVYYGIVKATKHSDGSVIWMNYDYAELTSYVTVMGYVNDAETGLPISGAKVNITQGSIFNNLTTIADGNYSATYMLSGSPITIDATEATHQQYLFTFTPLIAKTINVNISLINNTPVVNQLGIGGIAHDSAYGQPLAGVAVVGTNLSAAVTNASTGTGYYLLGQGDLLNESYYNVSGSKAGYSNSSTASVSINGSVSNFTHQDLWLTGQYLQTFSITDAETLAAITNVSIVSSSGKSYQTTNGTGYLTEPFGLYTITFSSEGYYPRTISYVFDADDTHAVALTRSSTSIGVSVPGTPKDVKFHIQSFWGAPITGANVTIQGITTTTGSWDWVATLLSIDLDETPINSTAMTGLTDTNGDAVFLMLDSIKYNISVSASGYTFPLTYISPQARQYTISANMNDTWFASGNNTLKEVNVTVSWVHHNDTYSFANITYDDATGTTTGGNIEVYLETTNHVANASPITLLNITDSVCSNSTLLNTPTGGASYKVVVNATTVDAPIVREFTHYFKGSPVNLPGWTPETQLWLALFIVIFTAAFAGALHSPQMAVILCVESWVFWAIGWLNYLISGMWYTEVAVIGVLTLATFITIWWNVTEGKAKGKRSS